MKSIMQTDKSCYLCGRKTCLERHHVMSGTANRKLSEEHGLWVWLCHDCHTGTQGAQYDKQKNWDLRKQAQIAFEEKYDHDKWMSIFYKNYIY
ncbi:MAG: hypothetical protein J6Y20_10035 [Lachnospiraceae bacterium]|nr:hypothetical protein [Lachnospiraceae bacterium]MBP5462452.1 hypothetical protein [Lachnospiraceae bacterium]